MSITIKEIAEILGISQATVSLALNDKKGVNKNTSKSVLEIAEKYGYTKRGMQVLNKNILLIKYLESGIAIEQNGDFVSRLVDAIENTASELGYNLIIKNLTDKSVSQVYDLLKGETYQGCVVLATEILEFEASFIEKIKIPVVCVDNMIEYYDIDCVVMDNRSGIFNAAKYLYEIGHRKIGYIDSTIRLSNFVQRSEGYYNALKKLGIEIDEKYVFEVYPSIKGTYSGVLKKLGDAMIVDYDKLPTAFIAGNDSLAIGAIKAFREKGIKIPDDMSIVGFDDIPSGQVLEKSLTTMRVDKRQIGETAMRRLDYKIKKGTAKDGAIKTLSRTKLIVRETTKEPRK
ncbi:MAG: LacI family DNA-binding transcriptional regulator [Lachnospirales bacterium]